MWEDGEREVGLAEKSDRADGYEAEEEDLFIVVSAMDVLYQVQRTLRRGP